MRCLLPALSVLLLLPTPAWAGRKKKKLKQEVEEISDRGPAATAEDIPMLARLLARTGWQPTPELSGAFRPGYVFLETEQGHRLQLEDCFTVPATASNYTAAEVVSQLQAGVSVELGLASVGASGGIVKKVRFGTPVHYSVPMLKMIPTQACRQALLSAEAVGMDLDHMYAVQEVLTAEITEQTCGRLDASGRFVGVGSADLELAAGCAQSSMDPVAVAYRTTPVADLVALYSSTLPEPEPQTAPTTQAPADSELIQRLGSLVPDTAAQAAPAPSAEAETSLFELLSLSPTPSQVDDDSPPPFSLTAALQQQAGEERPVLVGAEGIDWSVLGRGLESAQEERAEDPTGSSIYDSLTFENRDEKLAVSAVEPAAVAAATAAVLQAGQGQVSACGADAQGRWRLHFQVGADGEPRDVVVSGWDQGDGAVEACIADVASDWRFDLPPAPYDVVKSYRFGE